MVSSNTSRVRILRYQHSSALGHDSFCVCKNLEEWKTRWALIPKEKKREKVSFLLSEPIKSEYQRADLEPGLWRSAFSRWAGSAGGVWPVQVTGPLSLRPDDALPPSYLRLCTFHQGCTDIYCRGKQRTFICFILRGVSSIVSLCDLEIKGTFKTVQTENMEEKKMVDSRREQLKKAKFNKSDLIFKTDIIFKSLFFCPHSVF